MNKCIITGRIVKDPTLEHTKQGTPICQFSIATNRPIVRDGKRETDFINCVVWNKQAENLVKFQKKGNLVGVTGELRIDKYEVNNEKKYKAYILCQEIEFLEAKKDMAKEEQVEFDNMSTKTIREEQIEIKPEDLPF